MIHLAMYGANISAGYGVALNANTSLVPSLGLSHTSFLSKSYNITNILGTSNVSSSKAPRSSAILGVKIEHAFSLQNKENLNSEIHAFVDSSFKNKLKNPTLALFNVVSDVNTEKMHI